MRADPAPLTVSSFVHTWHADPLAAVAIVLVLSAFAWCCRRARDRGRPVERARLWCVAIGTMLWLLSTMSAIGSYAQILFWVRALQVVTLLYVVPLFLALSRPVTVVQDALGPEGRRRVDRLLNAPLTRMLAHPATTSLAMLGTPWLLYLTAWYTAGLEHEWIAALTRIVLVCIGFGYFYARLQADPVPRRYPQLLSLLITVGEAIGDGILGLVIWQGPLIAPTYYAALHRTWGPDLRLDQTIGAGVLWVLGDVVGVPFVLLLMRALSRDEKSHAMLVDAELDKSEAPEGDSAPASGLWWENAPELSRRFRREK